MTAAAPGRRALVVEDDAVIAMDLTRSLGHLGYPISEVAATGDAALTMALSHPPDLVLMDIWLPGGRDGIQIAAELRRKLSMPIVFITGQADEETLRRAVATDAAGFILKPFSPASLKAEIELANARHERGRKAQLSRRTRPSAQITPGEVAAIAHDFNNLLTLIAANADALRTGGKCEEAEQICRAAQLATMLCRQLLPSAAAGRGETVDLNCVLESNLHLIERALGSRCRVRLKTASQPLHVQADEGMISRICFNLALNARNAMPQGGELRIVTRKMARSLAQLSISDTGTGMDAATLERIFDPFFSAREGTGTGLGLSIVRGILDQIGGAISVESEPGAGTTFGILLPLANTAVAVRSVRDVAPPQHASSGRPSVLLVEDHDDLRGLVCDHLEFSGFECVGASDAEEAIAAMEARGAPVDLLVTDVSIPGMDGVELATECLRRAFCARVLFISGFTGPPAGQNSALLRRRSDFLAKPFTASELAARVASILRSTEQ